MKKKCRVYKKPMMKSGGQSFVTQDSGSQPIPENRVSTFMNSIKQNQANFKVDEEIADKIEIVRALTKDIPELKAGGAKFIKAAQKGMTRKGAVGKLTEFSGGGKINHEGIEKALQSEDSKIRERAQYARNAQMMMDSKFGGMVPELQMAVTGTEVNTKNKYGVTERDDAYGVEERDDLIQYKDSKGNYINNPATDAYRYASQVQMNSARKLGKDAWKAFKPGFDSLVGPTRYQVNKDFEGEIPYDDIASYTPGMGGKHAYFNLKDPNAAESIDVNPYTPELNLDPEQDMQGYPDQEDEIIIEDIQPKGSIIPSVNNPGSKMNPYTPKLPDGFRDGGEYDDAIGYLKSIKEMRDGGTYDTVETGEGLLDEDNFIKTKRKWNGNFKQKEISEKRFNRIQDRYDRRGGHDGGDNPNVDNTVHRRGNKSVSDMNAGTPLEGYERPNGMSFQPRTRSIEAYTEPDMVNSWVRSPDDNGYNGGYDFGYSPTPSFSSSDPMADAMSADAASTPASTSVASSSAAAGSGGGGMAYGGALKKAQQFNSVIDPVSQEDSIAHQADKVIKYEQLMGSKEGDGLPIYSNPKYKQTFMDIASKLTGYNSAMEKSEAADFIFNSGNNPKRQAIQEFYRKNNPELITKDKYGRQSWVERNSMSDDDIDKLYKTTVGSLKENDRRVMNNLGRDWYYKNSAPKGVSYDYGFDANGEMTKGENGEWSPAYQNTWYGRIHNTNTYNEFNPDDETFVHPSKKKKHGGSLKKAQINNSQIDNQYAPDFGGFMGMETDPNGFMNGFLNQNNPEQEIDAEVEQETEQEQSFDYKRDVMGVGNPFDMPDMYNPDGEDDAKNYSSYEDNYPSGNGGRIELDKVGKLKGFTQALGFGKNGSGTKKKETILGGMKWITSIGKRNEANRNKEKYEQEIPDPYNTHKEMAEYRGDHDTNSGDLLGKITHQQIGQRGLEVGSELELTEEEYEELLRQGYQFD